MVYYCVPTIKMLRNSTLKNPIIIACYSPCIHRWGTTIKTMTPFCLMSKVLKQNQHFKMLNNERGICMFNLSINKYYYEWFKSIE